MNGECIYYGIHRTTLESREIGRERSQPSQVLEQPYCEHPKHSPLPRRRALRGALGGLPLDCKGELARCPIIDRIEDTD